MMSLFKSKKKAPEQPNKGAGKDSSRPATSNLRQEKLLEILKTKGDTYAACFLLGVDTATLTKVLKQVKESSKTGDRDNNNAKKDKDGISLSELQKKAGEEFVRKLRGASESAIAAKAEDLDVKSNLGIVKAILVLEELLRRRTKF